MRARLTEATWDKIEAFEAEAKRLGVTPAILALAWNLKGPGVTAPIMGPHTAAQLEENLSALSLEVPDETMQQISALNPPFVPYPHGFGQPRT
jgi:aryl-alcohol dehydrogenase-like predicted oxidoreductase